MKKRLLWLLLLLPVAVLGWLLFRPATPDMIAARAYRALKARDVDMLLKLAGEEEKQRLHLNRENVEMFLSSTFWREQATIGEYKQHPGKDYLRQYVGSVTNKAGTFPITVFVCDSPNKGWHLSLSYTLYSLLWPSHPYEADKDALYKQIASSCGISGRWASGIGWVMNSQ